jgi:hypothetical protein
MQRLTQLRILTLILGFPVACGSSASPEFTATRGSGANDGLIGDDDAPSASPGLGAQTTLNAAPFTFPGAGTSQAAQPITAGSSPETSDECNPAAVANAFASSADVQTVCFYDESEPNVPAATIEQLVEVIGTNEWVHVRLTLNPDFVDNTYGANAIAWGDGDGIDAPAPPPGPGATDGDPPEPPVDQPQPPAFADAGAPPPADAPPPARPGRDERGGRPRPGRGGHSFNDLVGSDHAEFQLLDANGGVALQFRLDYLSASDSAVSGFESLGVSGGEGRLITGDEAMILASTTSLTRNLEACGLPEFLEESPATDELYTPNPDALEWDYRVSYEVWVAVDAFGSAGFGSALIEQVHASPSKLQGNSVDVRPAPCPPDPTNPTLEPEALPPVLSNLR